MKKQLHKIRRIQSLGADNNLNKSQPIENKTNQFSRISRLIVELSLVGLVAIVIYVFIKEIRRPEIILDTISVPEDIAKLGYTGFVVAEKLADEAHKIDLAVRDLSSKRSWKEKALNINQINTISSSPDLVLPMAQTSVRSVFRFIRQEFGISSTYIRGELVHEKDHIVLTLRKISDDVNPPAEQISVSSENINQIFVEGGVSLLKLTTPAALAIKAFHEFENNLNKQPKEDSNFTNAVEVFKYCLKYAPISDDSLALTLWGHALSYLERNNDSIEKYKQAIGIDPDFASAYNGYGLSLHNLKKFDEAIEKYKQAIAIDPDFASAYNGYGTSLQELKKFDEAIEKYKQAIAIDPDFAYAYNGYGTSLQELKKFDEAIEKYKQAIAIDPKNADAYNNWGVALREQKKFDEAIEKHKQAIAIDPKDALAYTNWGNSLNEQMKFDEAIEKYKQALAIDPKNVDIYIFWGFYLHVQKKFDKAIEQYKHAIAIDPKNVMAYKNWGIALWEQKKFDEANEKFDIAESIRRVNSPSIFCRYFNIGCT